MKSADIQLIINRAAQILEQDPVILGSEGFIDRSYGIDELTDFKFDLTKQAIRAKVLLLERRTTESNLKEILQTLSSSVLVFEKHQGVVRPAFLQLVDKEYVLTQLDGSGSSIDIDRFDFVCDDNTGEVIYLAIFTYQGLVSNGQAGDQIEEMSPMQRLYRLLLSERKDIIILLVYALFIGGIGLTLPLGIQATVELVSGGVLVSSVFVLISLVIIGVIAAGFLQVMQISIVEYIQRRIFTRAALEFAIKIPKIKIEAITSHHAPELINRFFDVLTLQKGLPKLLIDMTAGVMQILFGLLLLSFYHPFFVFFGITLIGVLSLIFLVTGPKGLRTSIKESKYKYKVVYWLEEVARTLNSFKISGNTILPVRKTEENVNDYLSSRRSHFRVLVSQFSYVIVFKAAVTGGLLIIGTYLVVQKEITLGQFVASEVIIILILSSVEKIILYMEVVYDLLTAVDKIAGVTDLPIEEQAGITFPSKNQTKGFDVELKEVSFKHEDSRDNTINQVNLQLSSGEKICISGPTASGKSTLVEVISGFQSSFEGAVTFDGVSIRDLEINYLRDKIGKNVSQNDIFDGTILENILVGKPNLNVETAFKVIAQVGLSEKINTLPDGVNTHILSGGKGFSSSFINRLILARCLAKEPRLLILNDFFMNFSRKEKLQMFNLIEENYPEMTMLTVSNDPVIMSICDRVAWMENGQLLDVSPYEKLIQNIEIKETVAG